jgi:hypothetical protein
MSPTSTSPSSCRAAAWYVYVLNIDPLVLTTGTTCFKFQKRVLNRSVCVLC